MCRKITIIIAVTMFLASLYVLTTSPWRSYRQTSLNLNKQPIKLYLADNEAVRNRGLSAIPCLAKNEGMLFVFDRPDYYSFWMKEMRFPLDIIFVNNRRVVDIVSNLSPDTYPRSVQPRTPANCVVELNAGVTKILGLSRGSTLHFEGDLCQ